LILKRYINREILPATAAILTVLILIFISTRFIKYIQMAVDGSLSSSAVFTLLGLQVPAVAGFLLPLSFFVAILLTFGRLYAENEMAVIQGVGIGELQLGKYLLPTAAGLALISGLLSFWVTPASSQLAREIMAREKAESQLGSLAPGKFQETASQSGVVFVGGRDKNDNIRGIFAVSGLKAEESQFEIKVARSGRFVSQEVEAGTSEDSQQNYLNLNDGQTYVFDRISGRWHTTEYQSYFMSVEPAQIDQATVRNRSMSTRGLLDKGGAQAWAELHWRLSAPLTIPILSFMAIPLARTQPRKGRMSRLFPAIMVYLVYALLMMNSRRLIEAGQIPWQLGFWWIHGLAIAFCLWLYRPRTLSQNALKKARNV